MSLNNAQFFNFGYEVESSAGTDPATTRLAWPGEVKVFEPRVKIGKETYFGPASVLAAGRYQSGRIETELHVEYVMFDDNASNSRLSQILSNAAPNGGTGAITIATVPRTSTVQFGMDMGTDVYFRIRNCVTKRMEIKVEPDAPVLIAEDIAGISLWAGTDTQATAWAAAPSAFTGTPHTHPGTVNWALSGATLNGTVTGGSIVYERPVIHVPGVNSTQRVATSIAAGSTLEVSGSLSFVPDDFTAWTSFITEPNASNGSFTQTVTMSKNSAAQYTALTFPSSYFKDADAFLKFDQSAREPWQREFNWSCAGTITADVIA